MIRRIFLFAVVSLLSLLPVWGGVVDHDMMFRAFLDGDMKRWEKELKGYMAKPDLTVDDKIDLSNYLYGYIATIVDNCSDDELESWLTQWEGYLNDVEKAGRIESTVRVYRSSAAAYRAKAYTWRMIPLARVAIKEINKALEIDSQNPIAIALKGNIEFYMPKAIGGSKKKAIEYYERSLELMRRNPQTLYRWNRCAMELCLAQAYEKTGNKERALEIATATLNEFPDYAYIRDIYLPSLKAK